MRGGAQAHLLECDDGRQYVVKFANNPQGGPRILVNELIASLVLTRLGIATPGTALVAVDQRFLREYPEVAFTGDAPERAIRPGIHFGSLHTCGAVLDFLPDALLADVNNRDDFLGALVADKWLGNVDMRQCVFSRALIIDGHEQRGIAWVARMIDHGFAFNGPNWVFRDSPVQGVYGRLAAYGRDQGRFLALRNFEPWLASLTTLPREVLDEAFLAVPSEWIGGQEHDLRRLLKKLGARREIVPRLVADSILWIKGKDHRDWRFV